MTVTTFIKSQIIEVYLMLLRQKFVTKLPLIIQFNKTH